VSGLAERGLQRTPAGNLYLFLSEAQANAGDVLRFHLSGRPLGAAPPGADPRAIGVGLIAIGLAIGIAYLTITRVRTFRTGVAETLTLQREQHLREIAALDDDFAQGRLQEHDYRKRRDRLKGELLDVWEQDPPA
jgi:hypothetical protein